MQVIELLPLYVSCRLLAAFETPPKLQYHAEVRVPEVVEFTW